MKEPPQKWPTWVIAAIALVLAVALVWVVLVVLFLNSDLFGGSGY